MGHDGAVRAEAGDDVVVAVDLGHADTEVGGAGHDHGAVGLQHGLGRDAGARPVAGRADHAGGGIARKGGGNDAQRQGAAGRGPGAVGGGERTGERVVACFGEFDNDGCVHIRGVAGGPHPDGYGAIGGSGRNCGQLQGITLADHQLPAELKQVARCPGDLRMAGDRPVLEGDGDGRGAGGRERDIAVPAAGDGRVNGGGIGGARRWGDGNKWHEPVGAFDADGGYQTGGGNRG